MGSLLQELNQVNHSTIKVKFDFLIYQIFKVCCFVWCTLYLVWLWWCCSLLTLGHSWQESWRQPTPGWLVDGAESGEGGPTSQKGQIMSLTKSKQTLLAKRYVLTKLAGTCNFVSGLYAYRWHCHPCDSNCDCNGNLHSWGCCCFLWMGGLGHSFFNLFHLGIKYSHNA